MGVKEEIFCGEWVNQAIPSFHGLNGNFNHRGPENLE
jgi:hypothetical protein